MVRSNRVWWSGGGLRGKKILKQHYKILNASMDVLSTIMMLLVPKRQSSKYMYYSVKDAVYMHVHSIFY